jgi:quercetin dioxygenase-like cupin family protein
LDKKEHGMISMKLSDLVTPKYRIRLETSRQHPGRALKNPRGVLLLVGVCSLAVGFGLGSAVGQQSPPTENKGLDAKVESTIDLGPDFPGYQLRLRTITFEPGGVAAFHSHKERPAFAYILEGRLTELRPGGYETTLGPGGFITESRAVDHWAENRGAVKVVLIGVDVIKQP